MAAATPGPLDRDVLDREDLRRALAEHDFAAAFALVKKYGGLSQNRIAVACHLTPGKVSTIISGSQRVTSFEVICRIADGLRIPGALVGLAPRQWEAQEEALPQYAEPLGQQPRTEDAPWRADATMGLAVHLTRSDLVLDRRAAARALTGTALSGAALFDDLEAWLQPSEKRQEHARQGRLGATEIEELEGTARAFRSWDHKFGGGLRRKAVLGQLNEVAGHLEEHQTADVEQRLYRVMAQLSATAAAMAWDYGAQKRAQDYHRLALRASHSGGDTAFGANVLAAMARQMLYRDRPQEALELVRFAQDGSRKVIGPRVRAMLHTREAWAYAAMGRTSAFRRATGNAAEALEDADQVTEPYWIAYFGEAELAGVTGARLLDLARNEPKKHAAEAAGEIRGALARRGPEAGRSHALDRIGLAECHFLVGDVHEAVEQTHEALNAAMNTRSSRVRARLGKLYPHTVGQSAPRAVAEVRTRIREQLAS